MTIEPRWINDSNKNCLEKVNGMRCISVFQPVQTLSSGLLAPFPFGMSLADNVSFSYQRLKSAVFHSQKVIETCLYFST